MYYSYFGTKLCDQDKSWALRKICHVYVEDLRKWSKGEKKVFTLWCSYVSMMWREPKNHCDNCCFCSCDLIGYYSASYFLPNTTIQHLWLVVRIPISQQPKFVEDIMPIKLILSLTKMAKTRFSNIQQAYNINYLLKLRQMT